MQSTMQVARLWQVFTDHMLIMDYDEDWFAVENWIVRI